MSWKIFFDVTNFIGRETSKKYMLEAVVGLWYVQNEPTLPPEAHERDPKSLSSLCEMLTSQKKVTFLFI
jgi:hypothetical protein